MKLTTSLHSITPSPWKLTLNHTAMPCSSKSAFDITGPEINGISDIVCYVGQPGAMPGDKVKGMQVAEANAKLIAAAPAMLEALQQALFALPTDHACFQVVRDAIKLAIA